MLCLLLLLTFKFNTFATTSAMHIIRTLRCSTTHKAVANPQHEQNLHIRPSGRSTYGCTDVYIEVESKRRSIAAGVSAISNNPTTGGAQSTHVQTDTQIQQLLQPIEYPTMLTEAAQVLATLGARLLTGSKRVHAMLSGYAWRRRLVICWHSQRRAETRAVSALMRSCRHRSRSLRLPAHDMPLLCYGLLRHHVLRSQRLLLLLLHVDPHPRLLRHTCDAWCKAASSGMTHVRQLLPRRWMLQLHLRR